MRHPVLAYKGKDVTPQGWDVISIPSNFRHHHSAARHVTQIRRPPLSCLTPHPYPASPQISVAVSLSAVAVRLSKQQARDAVRLLEYMRRVFDADVAAAAAQVFGDHKFGALPPGARARWAYATSELMREQVRRSGASAGH